VLHISAIVEPKWTHSGAMHFVCNKAAGISIRHHALNELVPRAVSAAAIPNTKEQCRSDGKRSDGLTLVP